MMPKIAGVEERLDQEDRARVDATIGFSFSSAMK
jgi:hypothetical protein